VCGDLDAKLMQTNIGDGSNNNKFYILQTLYGEGQYRVIFRWGRLGETGQSKVRQIFEGNLPAVIQPFPFFTLLLCSLSSCSQPQRKKNVRTCYWSTSIFSCFCHGMLYRLKIFPTWLQHRLGSRSNSAKRPKMRGLTEPSSLSIPVRNSCNWQIY